MRTQPLSTIFLEHDFKEAVNRLEGDFAYLRHVDRSIRKTMLVLAPNGDFVALFLYKGVDIDLLREASAFV